MTVAHGAEAVHRGERAVGKRVGTVDRVVPLVELRIAIRRRVGEGDEQGGWGLGIERHHLELRHLASSGLSRQVLSEVADEVTDDEAVAEAPAAVDLLERVVVAAGDHALQRKLGGGLVHGEHRPRAGDAAVVVELENGVVRDVLRAQRAVVVDLVVLGFQRVHLVVAVVLVAVVHAVSRVAEELGHAGEVGGVLQLAVPVEQIQDLAFVVHVVTRTSCAAARSAPSPASTTASRSASKGSKPRRAARPTAST